MINLLPAAVSDALRAAFHGEPTPLRCLATFPRASYLQPVSSSPPVRDCPPLISVVTADAVILPNAVVLPPGQANPACPARGREVPAVIGGGQLVLGDVVIRPARWWAAAPTVAAGRSTADLAQRADQLMAAVSPATSYDPAAGDHVRGLSTGTPAGPAGAAISLGVLTARADDVVAALRRAGADGAVQAGRALVGLGPGLTPSGDDVLSGVLVAANVLGRGCFGEPQLDALVMAGQRLVAHAAHATTAVSHASLWHASRGQAAGPVAAVLRALAGHGTIEAALPPLLAVGSSSGRDLAVGLAIGARFVADAPLVDVSQVGVGGSWS